MEYNSDKDCAGLKEVPEQSIEARLFSIIDDIDTASDMFKPKMEAYEKYICKKVREARAYICSDGHKLFYKETP